MTIHVIHGFTFDTTALPPATIDALIKRGLSHVIGNECASKVSGMVKRDAEAEPAKVWSADEKTAALSAARSEASAAILDGTLGARVVTPKSDTVEGIMSAKARTEVQNVLKDAGLGVPKKADEKVTTASGSFTMAELIARRIAKHGDRLKKEAEKELKARKANTETETDADL